LPPASIRAFVDDSVEPHVRGFLHLPENPNHSGLILTHGAGSNAQAPLLIVLAETFSAAGFTILRCDLPYRQARSFGPPGPGDAARDRAGLQNAIASLKKILGELENPGAPFKPGFGLSGGFDSSNNQDLGAPLLADVARSGVFPSNPAGQPMVQNKIYLGGHSYGGRQCSILCAELAIRKNMSSRASRSESDGESRDLELSGAPFKPAFGLSGDFGQPGAPLLADVARKPALSLSKGGDFLGAAPNQTFVELEPISGLLLLSYPLHPPRKPDQQRTQHLPNLHTPTLFVHGTRDPFGTIAELEQAMKMIPAKTKLLPVEGAGHDLGFKGKAKKQELPNLIFSEFAKFLSS
jgi:predicted alpha/beta-hydrolase family hydrolase